MLFVPGEWSRNRTCDTNVNNSMGITSFTKSFVYCPMLRTQPHIHQHFVTSRTLCLDYDSLTGFWVYCTSSGSEQKQLVVLANRKYCLPMGRRLWELDWTGRHWHQGTSAATNRFI